MHVLLYVLLCAGLITGVFGAPWACQRYLDSFNVRGMLIVLGFVLLFAVCLCGLFAVLIINSQPAPS
jgi:hypothetical protein